MIIDIKTTCLKMNINNTSRNINDTTVDKVMRDLEILTDTFPSIRICFIGDCGVGKSSIIYKIMKETISISALDNINSNYNHNKTENNDYVGYKPTIGCDIEIIDYMHEYFGRFFIEICDMGGNPRYQMHRYY